MPGVEWKSFDRKNLTLSACWMDSGFAPAPMPGRLSFHGGRAVGKIHNEHSPVQPFRYLVCKVSERKQAGKLVADSSCAPFRRFRQMSVKEIFSAIHGQAALLNSAGGPKPGPVQAQGPPRFCPRFSCLAFNRHGAFRVRIPVRPLPSDRPTRVSPGSTARALSPCVR